MERERKRAFRVQNKILIRTYNMARVCALHGHICSRYGQLYMLQSRKLPFQIDIGCPLALCTLFVARCPAHTVQQNHGFPWIWLPEWAAGPPWALGYAQPMRNLCASYAQIAGSPLEFGPLGRQGGEAPVRACARKWHHVTLLMSRGQIMSPPCVPNTRF